VAIYKKGADPDALDRSAALLVQYGRETAAMRQSVSVVLGSLKDNWGGGNLQALIQQPSQRSAHRHREGGWVRNPGDVSERRHQDPGGAF